MAVSHLQSRYYTEVKNPSTSYLNGVDVKYLDSKIISNENKLMESNRRVNDYVTRIMSEGMREGYRTLMILLTYDNEHLPFYDVPVPFSKVIDESSMSYDERLNLRLMIDVYWRLESDDGVHFKQVPCDDYKKTLVDPYFIRYGKLPYAEVEDDDERNRLLHEHPTTFYPLFASSFEVREDVHTRMIKPKSLWCTKFGLPKGKEVSLYDFYQGAYKHYLLKHDPTFPYAPFDLHNASSIFWEVIETYPIFHNFIVDCYKYFGDSIRIPCFERQHIVDFKKRFNEAIENKYKIRGIKYVVGAEYGSLTQRQHLHVFVHLPQECFPEGDKSIPDILEVAQKCWHSDNPMLDKDGNVVKDKYGNIQYKPFGYVMPNKDCSADASTQDIYYLEHDYYDKKGIQKHYKGCEVKFVTDKNAEGYNISSPAEYVAKYMTKDYYYLALPELQQCKDIFDVFSPNTFDKMISSYNGSLYDDESRKFISQLYLFRSLVAYSKREFNRRMPFHTISQNYGLGLLDDYAEYHFDKTKKGHDKLVIDSLKYEVGEELAKKLRAPKCFRSSESAFKQKSFFLPSYVKRKLFELSVRKDSPLLGVHAVHTDKSKYVRVYNDFGFAHKLSSFGYELDNIAEEMRRNMTRYLRYQSLDGLEQSIYDSALKSLSCFGYDDLYMFTALYAMCFRNVETRVTNVPLDVDFVKLGYSIFSARVMRRSLKYYHHDVDMDNLLSPLFDESGHDDSLLVNYFDGGFVYDTEQYEYNDAEWHRISSVYAERLRKHYVEENATRWFHEKYLNDHKHDVNLFNDLPFFREIEDFYRMYREKRYKETIGIYARNYSQYEKVMKYKHKTNGMNPNVY